MGEPAKNALPVLVAVDDLFFWSKIESTARSLNVELVQSTDARQLEERLSDTDPRLIILDLNSRSCRPLEAIRRIKSDPKLRETPVVAFLSHVQVDLERAARDAGCDFVLPRSAFSARLSELLRISKA